MFIALRYFMYGRFKDKFLGLEYQGQTPVMQALGELLAESRAHFAQRKDQQYSSIFMKPRLIAYMAAAVREETWIFR